MNPGTILFLNGTSSSGKSTLIKQLQSRLDEPFIDAGLDRFLWMLPSRYLDRPLWDDVLGRAVQAGQMGHTLVTGMHRAIESLSRSGLNVLADHVLVEPAWVDDCAQLFAGLPAYLIGVHCPLEVLIAREAARKDRTLGQAAAQFEKVHAFAEYDFSVDTGGHSPEACAAQVLAFLERREPPHAFKALASRPD